jgi:hypothetical protein
MAPEPFFRVWFLAFCCLSLALSFIGCTLSSASCTPWLRLFALRHAQPHLSQPPPALSLACTRCVYPSSAASDVSGGDRQGGATSWSPSTTFSRPSEPLRQHTICWFSPADLVGVLPRCSAVVDAGSNLRGRMAARMRPLVDCSFVADAGQWLLASLPPLPVNAWRRCLMRYRRGTVVGAGVPGPPLLIH